MGTIRVARATPNRLSLSFACPGSEWGMFTD